MPYEPTDRTTVKRRAERGRYDEETVHAILDEALIAHVGAVVNGAPVVIPTTFVRVGQTLYVHGSAANRQLRSLAGGGEACITVTLLDGLVMARSAFHHSMNYRSVVVLGRARVVEDDAERTTALEALTEKLSPGRWAEVRTPTPKEWAATLVLAVPLDEVSAKVRTGPPIDDEEDYALPVWAGVIPIRTVRGEPITDH